MTTKVVPGKPARNDARPEPEELLLVGVVVRAHALKGELVVHPFNQASPVWKAGQRLSVLTPEPGLARSTGVITDTVKETPLSEVSLTVVRPIPDERFIVCFEGVNTRDGSEALVGRRLGVPLTSLPPSEDESYYHHELKGLAVVTVEGQSLGVVVGVFPGPAQDLLEVLPPGKDADTFFIPFVDAIVKTVDRANGRVIVDPPEGLVP